MVEFTKHLNRKNSFRTILIRGKSVLVVSGSLADQGNSTLSWTVTNLDYSYIVYLKDCKAVGQRPKRVPPSRRTLPYDGKKKEALVFQPEEEGKAHVINVAEYFQNKEKFLEILRSESAFGLYIC